MMLFNHRLIVALAVLSSLAIGEPTSAEACRSCGKLRLHHGGRHAAPPWPAASAWHADLPPAVPVWTAPSPAGRYLPPAPVAPPPGTLGQTYRRPSRPVPRDKHPRVGMLEVRADGAQQVTVEGMEGFRGDDGLWHFESEDPLIPGLAHIYQVKATFLLDGRPVVEKRTVRLIMGRIVTLEF